MRRRALRSIVLVAALAVLAFGVPLAAAVERLYANQAVLQLEREAARAVVEVPASFATTTDPVELPEPSARTTLGLYGVDGALLLGSGPPRADGPTRAALAGSLRDGRAGGDVVVAAPVASEEEVVAVVRAATPMAEIRRRVALTWVAMAGFGLLIVATAALGARLLASRLATPVTSLAAATTRLGLGDFAVRADRSGIDELDRAAEALEATALRLGRLMERERSFSADASHQLRTPLTGLRLQLETALLQDQGERDATLHRALSEIDRLEATIDGLLHLARDTGAPRTPLDVPALVASVERTWQGRLAQENRRLLLSDTSEGRHPLVSAEAVAQVLDVLVGNALDHGSGTVQVVVRAAGDGLAIDVTDEGEGIAATEAEIFERRSGPSSTRGIGLALARSLAEAEGAKLTLRRPSPPCFTLLLPPSQ